MKLIVGLGNPGIFYKDTRHNAGARVVKSLAGDYKAIFKKDGAISALSAKIKIGRHTVILALPLTFMNLSGQAVGALIKKYKIELADLLVICDDLDLDLGRLKIRPKGASAGQRGLQSIIDNLGVNNFTRLRLGIGRPQQSTDAAKYVLSGFLPSEKAGAIRTEGLAKDCCRVWIERGIIESMNIFNSGYKAGGEKVNE